MKALAIVLVFAAMVASTASGRSSRTDPRVCAAPTSAKNCAAENASLALRAFMSRKESQAWDAQITCTGSRHWLRWYCTFRSDKPEKGSAVITFGKAPTWKRTVVLKSYSSGSGATTPGPGG